MSELVRFESAEGPGLVVEVDDNSPGLENISRDDAGVVNASQKIEEALAEARPRIESVLNMLRALAPDHHEIEFGIKLNAEAGVVVAKTAVEGHFNVKLSWDREQPK